MPSFDGPASIGQLAIPVADLDRAVTFYRDVLGLRLLFRAPPGLAFLDCGGVRLMLTESQSGEAPTPVGVIYYRVPDLTRPMRRFGRAEHRLWTRRIASLAWRITSCGWYFSGIRTSTSWH